MRDRLPTKVLENGALRYGVYDESGTFLRHEYLALDDAPTDTGTELSKATLLADETEVSLFGSAADRTVDDAFRGLAGQLKLIMGDMAQITVTLADSAGAAIPGVLVQGILSDSGQAVYSNDSGVVSGYISEGTQTIKVTGYADIVDYSETLSVTKGTAITKAVTLTTRNFLKITSSQSVKFSGNVNTVDVTVVGGGGGGGYASYNHTAVGGGGGYCAVKENVSFGVNVSYSAIVGSGGNAVSSTSARGGDGGTSSFLGVSAAGGYGGGADDYVNPSKASSMGLGNGRGGYCYATSDSDYNRNEIRVEPVEGSVAGFSSFTETTFYGGGGQGGCYYRDDDNEKRSVTNITSTTYGGKANYLSSGSGGSGQAGTGGGGGVYLALYTSTTSGKGGSGCVAIRMHLESA